MAADDKARSILERHGITVARKLIDDRIEISKRGNYKMNLAYWSSVKKEFENIVSQMAKVK